MNASTLALLVFDTDIETAVRAYYNREISTMMTIPDGLQTAIADFEGAKAAATSDGSHLNMFAGHCVCCAECVQIRNNEIRVFGEKCACVECKDEEMQETSSEDDAEEDEDYIE